MIFVLIYLGVTMMLILFLSGCTLRHMERKVATLQTQLDGERRRNAAADSVIARRNHLLGIAEPFSRN